MMDNITIVSQPTICSLKQFITHKYPIYCELFQYSKFPKQGLLIAKVLKTKTVISVMDESVSQLTQKAAVSWIITDGCPQMCGEGLAGCLTLYHDCDSYGSELFGIYCILAMVKVVVEFHRITSGSLTLACDNDASLLGGTDIATNTKIDPTYFYLIWEISELLRSIPLTVKKVCQGTCQRFQTLLEQIRKVKWIDGS